jgi:hypothetical protein
MATATSSGPGNSLTFEIAQSIHLKEVRLSCHFFERSLVAAETSLVLNGQRYLQCRVHVRTQGFLIVMDETIFSK